MQRKLQTAKYEPNIAWNLLSKDTESQVGILKSILATSRKSIGVKRLTIFVCAKFEEFILIHGAMNA